MRKLRAISAMFDLANKKDLAIVLIVDKYLGITFCRRIIAPCRSSSMITSGGKK
jgi:hypothetical protein